MGWVIRSCTSPAISHASGQRRVLPTDPSAPDQENGNRDEEVPATAITRAIIGKPTSGSGDGVEAGAVPAGEQILILILVKRVARTKVRNFCQNLKTVSVPVITGIRSSVIARHILNSRDLLK